MVLDASLLNTQHYKVRIKGKVEQSREGVAPPLHIVVVAIEKGAFGLPSTMVANFTFTYNNISCCFLVVFCSFVFVFFCFFGTQIYNIKYSYLIQIIRKHIYLTRS